MKIKGNNGDLTIDEKVVSDDRRSPLMYLTF